jgi:hypothetical protein
MYLTKEQQLVVEGRLTQGYCVLGKTFSTTNGLLAFVCVKGKHTVVINTLGYDEHSFGRTWKIFD